MKSDSTWRGRRAGRDAAKRYVDADAHPDDPERGAALIEWLERSPDHEAAFERCEAAVMLVRELAARGELDPLRAAAGRRSRRLVRLVDGLLASRGVPSAAAFGRRWLAGLGRPAVAWSVAAAAVAWAVVASVEREAPVRPGDEPARAAAAERALPAETAAAGGAPSALAGTAPAPAGLAAPAPAGPATPVRTLIASNPVAVLPGDIVVDVHSIAVLPFDQALEASGSAVDDADERAAAARIARQLHDEVMSQLSRIPGLYVVDGSSTAVYASGELAPEQIAALLSVRGVVAAGVELDGRTVRVSLRMTDAANAAWPTEIVLERPLDELTEVKTAIVANIADALDSTSF